jgi:carbonic anhydrase
MVKRFDLLRMALAFLVATFVMALPASAMAAGCPSEPDWSYSGDNGPAFWNTLFPIMCGQGVLQSPFDIVTRGHSISPAKLPRLRFHYGVAQVIFLDHDDQIEIDHGQGNFITIGNTEYELINVHVHTPSEYTKDGKQFPMEIHLVHQSPDGLLAVVGVLVSSGKSDGGVLEPPTEGDPSTVDLDLNKLIPHKKNYVRFVGSLTTPGNTAALPRCAEGVLWTEMLTPITMSQDQISAFEDSEEGCWGTRTTNRPLQPVNNRPVLKPIGNR